MVRQREETKQFFREMEANIKRKAVANENNSIRTPPFVAESKYQLDIEERETIHIDYANTEFLSYDGKRSRANSCLFPPRVRTISTMDDEILMTMGNIKQRKTVSIV